MKIHDVEQGSGPWLALRLAIPTASEFDQLITPLWKIKTGEAPKTYLYQKICEKFMGAFADGGSSFAMGQGSIMEHEALPWFSFTHEMPVTRVGFCTTDDGRIGCSPDGLIGEDGGIEIKCPSAQTHLRYWVEGVLPKEHAAQVHGSMYVTGRKFWYFLSYSRQFPAVLIRVERDEKIQEVIDEALCTFLSEYDELYLKLKTIKDAENAIANAAYEARVARGEH
jgi:hypothetical protein